MIDMTPAAAPYVATITPREVYVRAAGRAVSKEHARAALGAISNLYCLYELDFPGNRGVRFRGFTADGIASRPAVIAEIRKAVPGITPDSAEMILAALAESLDHAFEKRGCLAARLQGFGLLRRVDEPSAYTLEVELPLGEFLSAGPESAAALY
jgi:hypothetical protein